LSPKIGLHSYTKHATGTKNSRKNATDLEQPKVFICSEMTEISTRWKCLQVSCDVIMNEFYPR